MLSLDLFNSRYEKRLHEGAVDDAEYARLKTLGEKIYSLKQARAKTKDADMRRAIDGRIKEYDDERTEILSVRGMKEAEQTAQPQTQQTKGIGDTQDPKQKMAQLQQRSKKGPLANVAAGIKAFVKGEPEPMGEQTQPRTHAQNVYFEILKAWEDERDYIVLPFPNAPNPVTMIRGQLWNAIVDLGSIKDPKRRAKYVEDRFNDFESFMSWLGNLKRYKVPAKKKGKTQSLPLQIPQQPTGQAQPTAPGSPLMDPEFTGIKPPGNLQEKKKSSDLEPKDVGLSRELQKARARFPAAASDLEAGILDQMDQQQQAQQALARQQADLNRQDQQIAGLAQANQQHDGVMRAQGQEIDRLTQRLQQVMAQPTAAAAPAPVTPQAEPTTPAAPPAPDMVYVPDAPADTATQDREIARLNKQIQQLELMMTLKTPAEQSDLEDRIRDLEKARAKQEEKKRATAKKSAAKRRSKKQAITIDMEPAQAQLGFDASGDYLDPRAMMGKRKPKPEQGAEVNAAQATQAAIAKAMQPSAATAEENPTVAVGEGEMNKIDVMRQDLDSMSDLQFLRAHGMKKDQFKYKYRGLLKPAPQQDVPVQESLRPGEYHVHTVYFKDGSKKRIRVTSDEFDVVGYYGQRGQAVDRVDYDYQIHSDMTEQDQQPGTDIPRKSIIQGYTVYWNPNTQMVSVTRGGDSEQAAIEQARVKNINKDRFLAAAYRMIDRIEELAEHITRQPRTARERDDMIDKIRRMMTQDRNPANRQIMQADIEMLQTKYRDLKEDSDSTEAVEMAIMRRMLVAHTDLIMRHGLDGVVAAIEEVAEDVGEVDEIGKSDVSAYVRRVQRILEPDNEV